MASDLEDLHERIRWCRSQIVILAAEAHDYCEHTGIKMTGEINPNTGEGQYYINEIKPLPRSFSIQGGVIAHELRATLDNLACVLAQRNRNSPKNVYFCVARDEAAFETDGIKNKLKKLSDADRKVIAELKPWETGNPMLFALHSADLVRKHQRLIVTATNLGTTRILGLRGHARIFRSNKVDAAKQLIAISAPGAYLDAEMEISIGFAEPEILVGRPIQSVLRDFASLTESIVKLFD